MLAKLILIALASTGAWLSMACGPDRSEPSPTTAPEGVVLESISPTSGTLGAEVVLRGSGFTSEDNDVAFKGRGRTLFRNGLSSPDGNTLRFNLPDVLGICALSQMGPNEVCPSIGFFLPSGDIEISVLNHAGESGSVTFTVFDAK